MSFGLVPLVALFGWASGGVLEISESFHDDDA
jgi:hypothetical protein